MTRMLGSCTSYYQVHELEIPRAQAEKALAANGGDVVKTLVELIS